MAVHIYIVIIIIILMILLGMSGPKSQFRIAPSIFQCSPFFYPTPGWVRANSFSKYTRTSICSFQIQGPIPLLFNCSVYDDKYI
jgi:hypothetical protein